MADFKEDRQRESIESKSPTFRALIERSYRVDPKLTASELTYMGYWTIAAQLKIDYQSGLL